MKAINGTKPGVNWKLICTVALALFYARITTAQTTYYKITDLGTLGGTFALGAGVNNRQWVNGFSTLPGDQNVRAALWAGGLQIDLGTLGGPNSLSGWPLNQRGEVAGFADTSTPDPNGEDVCGFGTNLICRAFIWRGGQMTALPPLRGNNAGGFQINDRGQVAGAAEDNITDMTCVPPGPHEIKPVVWNSGSVEELPTFPGDPDGRALAINEKGQIVGFSGDCTTQAHALLWENGLAIDLGNLGGATNNFANEIDNQGHITGFSGIAGDPNNAHAFLWHNGVLTDLGVLPGDIGSESSGVNEKEQVVGGSQDISGRERAFLWENGVMYDLNTLSPDSPLFLSFAASINSQGDITGSGIVTGTGPQAGEVHTFIGTPIPAGAVGGNGALAVGRKSGSPPAVHVPERMRKLIQRRMGMRRLGFGLAAVP
jgi:probable HAF family extracellular repeat protein